MITFFAYIGLSLLILFALLAIGRFTVWVTNDLDYTMPWIISCFFLAVVLAIIIIGNLPIA